MGTGALARDSGRKRPFVCLAGAQGCGMTLAFACRGVGGLGGVCMFEAEPVGLEGSLVGNVFSTKLFLSGCRCLFLPFTSLTTG